MLSARGSQHSGWGGEGPKIAEGASQLRWGTKFGSPTSVSTIFTPARHHIRLTRLEIVAIGIEVIVTTSAIIVIMARMGIRIISGRIAM